MVEGYRGVKKRWKGEESLIAERVDGLRNAEGIGIEDGRERIL